MYPSAVLSNDMRVRKLLDLTGRPNRELKGFLCVSGVGRKSHSMAEPVDS